MFIYLVAPVATLLIIFGLLHVKCLDTWLRSSVRFTLTLYNGLMCRPPIRASFNGENLEDVSTPDRAVTVTSDRAPYEDGSAQKTMFSNNERLSDILLTESGSKSRNLNPSRYSFENVLLEERDRDLGLPAMRNLQLGTTQDNVIRTSKQEGKENIFESLKNSMEKNSYPSARLNTRQIYNLLLKETLKESEARQKLLDSDKNKFSESQLVEHKEQLPSSSDNKPEEEENINK